MVNNVKDIVRRSSQAVCGAFEREVSVKAENVAAVKAKLKAKGFFIVGTSEPGTARRKIWFIRQGGF